MKTIEDLREERRELMLERSMRQKRNMERIKRDKLIQENRRLKYPGFYKAASQTKDVGAKIFRRLGTGAANIIERQAKIAEMERRKKEIKSQEKVKKLLNKRPLTKYKRRKR